MDALATNLRRLRVAAGRSAPELAEDAGLAKATVWAIERGTANPRLDSLVALARALRVEVVDLLAPLPPPAIEVVRAGRGERVERGGWTAEVLAAGAMTIEVPPRHEAELPAEPGAWRLVYVLDGGLTTGPIEAPTQLAAGDCAAFPADGPALLRTDGRRARALFALTPGA